MISKITDEPGVVEAILVWHLDRLSRSQNMRWNLEDKFRENGVDLISACEPRDKQSEEMMKLVRRMVDEAWGITPMRNKRKGL